MNKLLYREIDLLDVVDVLIVQKASKQVALVLLHWVLKGSVQLHCPTFCK